ncbi:hypothetical protein ACWXVO_00810 [Mycoplasma sp. 1890]
MKKSNKLLLALTSISLPVITGAALVSCSNPSNPGPKKPEKPAEPSNPHSPGKPGDQGNPENKPKEKQPDKHETPDQGSNTTPPIVNPQKPGEGKQEDQSSKNPQQDNPKHDNKKEEKNPQTPEQKPEQKPEQTPLPNDPMDKHDDTPEKNDQSKIKKEDDNIPNDKNGIIKKFKELLAYYEQKWNDVNKKIDDLQSKLNGDEINKLTRLQVIQDNTELSFWINLANEINQKIIARFSELKDEKNMHKDVDEELLKKIKELITEFSKEKGDKLIEKFSEEARAKAEEKWSKSLAKQEELHKKLTELLEKITDSQTKEDWKKNIEDLYKKLSLTDELLQQLNKTIEPQKK